MKIPLTLPDLDLGDQPVTASCWLAPAGREVVRGDRLLEVSAGAVIVDLPAPATGVLAERCVPEGEPLRVGQVLAIVETEEGAGHAG